jgi:hypothetical protein
MQRWFKTCKSLNIIQHINRSKDKKHDYLKRCRKSFLKIQQLFVIKALMKLGIEGMYST